MLIWVFCSQENPDRANGQIFNVGNPNNEVTVRQLAEMMTEVMSDSMIICRTVHDSYSSAYGMRICVMQIYSKVSGEPPLEVPTINVSSKVFYGEGYDDSDKRIPDMTIINRQLGRSPSSVSPASNK